MEQEQRQEIRGLFQILEHTAGIADDSILTQAHKNGENRCISQFNKVLKRLSEIEAIPEDLFEPLQENATFSEISIACHHLAAYLSEGFGISADLKSMMTNILGKNFIDNIGEELKEGKIGDLIRKSMPDFLSVATLEDINHSFNVSHNGKLMLDTDFGTIDVQTTDSDVVNITVHRSAQLKVDRHATEILKHFHVNFHEHGNELHINAKFNPDNQEWKKVVDRLNIRFEITVPHNRYHLLLKTTVGDIHVADVNGNVQCRTSKGDLQYENITGPVFGYAGQGDIRVNKCKSDVRGETLRGNIVITENIGKVDTVTSGGNVRCTGVIGAISGETSGGMIKLIRCTGGAIVDTSSGGIELENDGPVTAKSVGGSIYAKTLGQIQDEWSLEATGGDITVSLQPNISANLDARSIGGEIVSEVPVTKMAQDPPKEWQLRGIINGEGPLLTLRSIGGDIKLKRGSVEDNR